MPSIQTLVVLLVLLGWTAAYDKFKGNIELVNAVDNAIASYIVANPDSNASSSVTAESNFYTCDVAKIKNVQFVSITDNGTFARILNKRKIRVGVNKKNDPHTYCSNNNNTYNECKVFSHVLKYIENTYRHWGGKDLKITQKWVSVSETDDKSDFVDMLNNDKVDIVISPFKLDEKKLMKGVLTSCSYGTDNIIDYDNNLYLTYKAFIFRVDYDKTKNGGKELFQNNRLFEVFNAGFFDWRVNGDSGIANGTSENSQLVRKTYKQLINDIYGYWDDKFNKIQINSSNYPPLLQNALGGAINNILYGHYVIVWMPGFNEKYDGYVGVHSKVGLEKTVLSEVFYKISEHYGRRVEIVFLKEKESLNYDNEKDDLCDEQKLFQLEGTSSLNKIYCFENDKRFSLASLYMDKLSPLLNYTQYVQFSTEYFSNSIAPIFSSNKYCVNNPNITLNNGNCKDNDETRIVVYDKDGKFLSLNSIINDEAISKICMVTSDRGTVYNYVKDIIDEGKIVPKSNTIELVNSVNDGTCDLALTDSGAVQYYFNCPERGINNDNLNETDCNYTMEYENTFQLNTSRTTEKTESLHSFSFDFPYAVAFKRDREEVTPIVISDYESKLLSILAIVFSVVGIALAVGSVFVPRGLVLRCVGAIREDRSRNIQQNNFISTNMLVDDQFVATKAGNKNVPTGPNIDDEW